MTLAHLGFCTPRECNNIAGVRTSSRTKKRGGGGGEREREESVCVCERERAEEKEKARESERNREERQREERKRVRARETISGTFWNYFGTYSTAKGLWKPRKSFGKTQCAAPSYLKQGIHPGVANTRESETLGLEVIPRRARI